MAFEKTPPQKFCMRFHLGKSCFICFNSIYERKISYVKLIFICWSSISFMKCILCKPKFHIWNFEPCHFTCKLGDSCMKTFRFHMWKERFHLGKFPIPYMFHMWNDMKFLWGTVIIIFIGFPMLSIEQPKREGQQECHFDMGLNLIRPRSQPSKTLTEANFISSVACYSRGISFRTA